MADSYVKVTEAPTDWSGDYLIVYEGDATHDAVAFNGGLETLDANSNNVAVTITDGVIAATDELNAAKFTIAAVTGGYSVQAANGKFIGATSYANSLATADEAIVNNLSITDGNAVIGVTTSGGDVTLRYNYAKNTWRFRYYKSGQQAVALYKFVASQGGGEDPQPAHTYTVVGSSEVAFGTTWAPTNTANDMTLVDGLYKWEKTGLTLPSGELKFKVCEDHDWAVSYPAQDYVLNIAESGVYTLTITYNPEGNVVNGVAQKTGDAVVIPSVAMHGNFGGSNWADTENFAIAEGNATASLTLNLAAGDYEFGMRIGGSGNWTANGAAFTRENNSAIIEAGQGNITLDADAAGEYTFTWTYETNTLTITYPEFVPPTYTYADGYYLIGLDMQDWTMEYMPTEGRLFAANPDNEGEYQLTITLAADQQFKVVSVQKDQIKAWYPDGMDNNFIVDAAHAGEKTVYFRPDGQGGEGWHYGCIYVAANEEQPEQPEMTAIYDWVGEIGTTIIGASNVTLENVKIHTNTDNVPAIKFASSYVYADGKYIAIKPANGGFKAGDVLSVAAVFSNSSDAKYAQVDVYAADAATRLFRSDSASTINGRTKAGDPIVQTYTLASDQDSLLLGRYGNTNLFITLLKVERAAGEEPVETPKFYVTGNAALVGQDKEWNPAAIKSMNDTLVLNLEADTDYILKVAVNGTWEGENNVKGYNELSEKTAGLLDISDDHNIGFRLAEAGEVKVVYIAAAEEQPEVFKLIGDFYIAPVAKYYLIGDSAFVVDAGATADKAWTPDAIASFNDTTVLNLKAGVDYIMRLSLNGTWENHRDFRHLTDTAAGLIELPDEFGNHSIGFRLNEAGPVTIIYIPAAEEQPEVFKLIGDFYVAPTPDPTVAVMGSMNDWAEEIPFTLSDDKTYASLTVENIGADEYEFKFIINGEWRSNGYRFHREFTGAAGITENNEANMVFVADQDGKYTFYWYFANDSAAIVYPEYIEPVYTLTNGYYLVGKFGGVDAWDPVADNLLAQNPDNNAEYQLAINLAVGDEIKVVEVENDAIKTWFPADGDNYLVDGNHAGATTMYFRPDYQGGEGWFANCIFIGPTGTVDITNIDANAPAVKAIRNGQFIIIKGEKTYNAQGTLVK